MVAALVVLAAVAVLIAAPWHRHTSSNGTNGSGHAASESREVAGFDGLELSGSNNVVVHIGGAQQVVVHGDDNLLTKVTTVVTGNQLRIANRGNFTSHTPMRVEVTVPALAAVTLSGSGMITIDGVSGERFTAVLPGSGLLRVSGTTTTLVANLSGSGDMELDALTARDATATVSGSGRIALTATGTLEATVSGSGDISYSGSPAKVTRTVTGSGSITGH